MRAVTARLFVSLACCAALAAFAAPSTADDKKAAETTTVKADELELTVPRIWKAIEPSNTFRKAVFEIPAVEGDDEPAEYVVFYFGGDGGGLQANVKRWIDQFQDSERKVTMTQGTSPAGKYVLVELAGTYNKPVGPPVLRKTEPMADARMLAVVLAVEGQGNYFLKLAGPDKTVAAVANSFRASFGGNAEKEEPYKLDE